MLHDKSIICFGSEDWWYHHPHSKNHLMRRFARAELTEEIKRTASVDPDVAYAVASVYALENDLDQAFDWLQRSISLGNENRFLFEHDRNLKTLRDDARFERLIGTNKTVPSA